MRSTRKKKFRNANRHRYEVNNDYREVLTENGMNLCGLSPDGKIVEMAEIKRSSVVYRNTGASGIKNPRPNKTNIQLFKGFVEAAAALNKH